MERAIALIRTHFSAAWSEKSAGLEVAPECVQVTVCLHGVHITSKPSKSMDSVLGGSFRIHPCCGARGNRDRGVVALGATADVGLSQDARTGFVPEPFANGFLTKSPETCPIGDGIMPLLKGLQQGNRKRRFALFNHRQPLVRFALRMARANCCPIFLPVIAFYARLGPLCFAFWASGEIGRSSNSVSAIRAT